jgi:hypothetical protein
MNTFIFTNQITLFTKQQISYSKSCTTERRKKPSTVQIKLVPIYPLETVADQFTSTNVPSVTNTE